MKTSPFDIGTVHFIGIGGIGMSGIAEVMHNLGYDVRGSDIAEGAGVKRLRAKSIPVVVGQNAENVDGAGVVVISSAIKADNPELQAARQAGIPVVRRAEMLAELMRLKWTVSVAGTHGKTTTTSMAALALEAAGIDPTVINGGIINQYGTNARLGEGDWMVVEADESDGTFVKLPATVAVVTNMDPEHLDFYGDFETEKAAFKQFLERVPFYGAAVLCMDHGEVQKLIPGVENRRVITYGLSPQADVTAQNLRFAEGVAHFDVLARGLGAEELRIPDISLPMPGEHNVQNALAAFAVGLFMGASADALRGKFAEFGGVGRRFSRVGSVAGVTIVDDYAHHPVEIGAVLRAARTAYKGRVVAVVQPHRFSRLDHLFDEFCGCFNDADAVVVAPVYAAGEEPIEGRDHKALAAALTARGVRTVATIDDAAELPGVLAPMVAAGDVVLCMGAGNITQWAHGLASQLDGVLGGADG